MKPNQITLLATLKNSEGVTIPYEVKITDCAVMGDLLAIVRKALVDKYGLEGEHELCGLRWVIKKGRAA